MTDEIKSPGLKAVLALGQYGEPVFNLLMTSDSAIAALTNMSGETVVIARAESEDEPVLRVEEAKLISTEFVTYAHGNDPGGIRYRQYERDPIPKWAVDVRPELVDPYAPLDSQSVLSDKVIEALIKKHATLIRRDNGNHTQYIEHFDKMAFAREIIALVAPTHAGDNDCLPAPKAYAYEYGRSNGDGTYSVVINRGDMVKIGPVKYEYGPPKDAVADFPVTPLFKQPL